MQPDYAADYIAVVVATFIGIALLAVSFFLANRIAPRHVNRAKASIYECGMLPIGDRWSQFHIRYYLFAILFVIFDVETIFLYPWAVVFQKIGIAAFIEMLLFIAILLFGLVYAWKRGVLKWT